MCLKSTVLPVGMGIFSCCSLDWGDWRFVFVAFWLWLRFSCHGNPLSSSLPLYFSYFPLLRAKHWRQDIKSNYILEEIRHNCACAEKGADSERTWGDLESKPYTNSWHRNIVFNITLIKKWKQQNPTNPRKGDPLISKVATLFDSIIWCPDFN